MDTIKVSLIIAITIIAYYLLMQWPPVTTQDLVSGDQILSEIDKQTNEEKVDVSDHEHESEDESEDEVEVPKKAPKKTRKSKSKPVSKPKKTTRSKKKPVTKRRLAELSDSSDSESSDSDSD